LSTDGLLGHEADAVVCKLAFTYAEKTDKLYSVVCGFMCNCISIAILWAPITVLTLRLLYSLGPYEFSPSSVAGWCMPVSVPTVIHLLPFYMSFIIASFSHLLASFLPSSLACSPSPRPLPYLLLFSCLHVLPGGSGLTSPCKPFPSYSIFYT